MPLIEKVDGEWVFGGRNSKHSGEKVSDVIQEDPGYIAWVWRDVMPSLPEETVDFLENLMEEHDLDPYSKELKRSK